MRNPKRKVTCLVLFLFLSSFALPGAFGATSDQIVINEFDLNPLGSDNYGSVEEWVELYNPTSEAVDIGGWTLSTTSGATVSVTIPGGTVIGANGYYVHRRGSQWLDNEGESVILRDASGKQIDGTPSRSDDDNDERAWSRYPNGQDTDSATDWRFQQSTEERSNGGEPPPPESEPEPEPEPEPDPEPTTPSIVALLPAPLVGNVTVHFIDVGQGDSIFVDTPGLDMLVDGGSKGAGDTVMGYLRSLNVTRIDFVVATHPHADHIGGLIMVLNVFNTTQVPVVLDSGFNATTDTYAAYLSAVEPRSHQVAVRGDTISLGNGVEITILNPSSPHEFEDVNDNSVVLLLRVYNVTFLLTGDSERHAESSILAAGYGQGITVLKVGHHGSQTSTSTQFLAAFDPEVAVISVGEGNRYGHPRQETLDKLSVEGSVVYRTDYHGTVKITTDGDDYTVIPENESPTPSPTPEPTPEPTPTNPPEPTPTSSPEPTPTVSPRPSPSPEPSPTVSPGPSPTQSPGPSPTASPGPSPTPSPKPEPQIPGFTPLQTLLGAVVAFLVLTAMSRRNT
jgi:beta-lactamase superfamily II metal-dependent hydrolase